MPPFRNLAGSLKNVHAGYGRYGVAAAIGAGAAALAAPLAIRNDERGYAQSSLITTPLIGAAYAVIPGLYDAGQRLSSDFTSFWSNKPFDFNFKDWRNPFQWKSYPVSAEAVGRMTPTGRRMAFEAMRNQEFRFYSGLKRTPYKTSAFAGKAGDLLQGYEDELRDWARRLREARRAGDPDEIAAVLAEKDKLVGRQRFLSFAAEEATLASAMPGEYAESAAAPWKSYKQMKNLLAANGDREKFVRTFYRRAQQAKTASLGRQVFAKQMLKTSSVERVGIAEALSRLPSESRAARLLTQMQTALKYQSGLEQSKRIADAQVVFGVTDGITSHTPLGVQFYNRYGGSKSMPFITEGRETLLMGTNWNQVGTWRSAWNPRGIYEPDAHIVNNLGGGFDDVSHGINSLFLWGGISDRTDEFDVSMHRGLDNVILPKHALRAQNASAAADPFGGFGPEGKLRYQDSAMTTADRVAAMEAADKLGLSVPPLTERGIATGTLYRKQVQSHIAGAVASGVKADPTTRAMTKISIDPATIPEGNRLSFLPTGLADLGFKERAELPFFSARLGMVSPQVQTEFGKISGEAELLARSWTGEEYAEYVKWGKANRDSVQASLGMRRAQVEAHRTLLDQQLTHAQTGDARVAANSALNAFEEEHRQLLRGGDRLLTDTINSEWVASRAYKDLKSNFARRMEAELGDLFRNMPGVRQMLVDDPLNVIAAREMQTLGETIYNVGDNLSRIELPVRRVHHLTSIEEALRDKDQWKDLRTLGTDQFGTVFLPENARVLDVKPGDGAYNVITEERYGIGGGKGEGTGQGDKVLFHQSKDIGRQVQLNNAYVRAGGYGGILPENVEMLSAGIYTAPKTTQHYDALMSLAVEMSDSMVYTKHIKGGELSQNFHSFLQQNQFRGYAEISQQLRQMPEEEVIARLPRLGREAVRYMDELGDLALSDNINHPWLKAYREDYGISPVYGEGEGAVKKTFSEWAARNIRQTRSSIWDHTALNPQRQAGITWDMFQEMKRLGHHAGLADLYQQARLPQGDSRIAGRMMEYLAIGDFTTTPDKQRIANILSIDDIRQQLQGDPGFRLGTVEARTGNSIFNPSWDVARNNLAVELPGILKDVEIQGQKTDLRYLTKLGMDSWKGGANQAGADWYGSKLEHLYANMVSTAAGLDWAKPNEKSLNKLRAEASEYHNLLYSSLAGKEGRPVMTHPNAAMGVFVERQTGFLPNGEADPFAFLLHRDTLRGVEDPELLEKLKAGKWVEGSMFRHPVSGQVYGRFRVDIDDVAHLDPNTIGANSRSRSILNADHDKDDVITTFHQTAESQAEARAAMDWNNRATSSQWKMVRTAEMLQAMENPAHITPAIYEAEMAENSWFGPKSMLKRIEDAVHTDRTLEAAKHQTLLDRMNFIFTGQFSNETSRLQLMLAANPNLRPTDAGYQLLDKMLFNIRQTGITSSKGSVKFGGKTPEQLKGAIDSAVRRGGEGAEQLAETFAIMAKGMGFKSVVDEETVLGEKSLLGDLRLRIGEHAGKTVREAYQGQQTFNGMQAWAESDLGLSNLRTFLESPNNAAASQLASFMTRSQKHFRPDEVRSLFQRAPQMDPVIGGMVYGMRRTDNAFVRAAYNLAGKDGGRAAEQVSEAIGMINQGLKETAASAGKAIGPAGKILGIGLAAAAVGGLLTAATSSSNKQRPEEQIAAPEHIPGEPIAGSRASVNPTREVLPPASQGVKTAVVAKVNRSADIDVRAKAPDRRGGAELSKLIERTVASGNTNVTVNRVGGWRDRVAKPSRRRQFREEMDRY